MIAKWAQEDVETLDNLLNNNNNQTYKSTNNKHIKNDKIFKKLTFQNYC